MKVSAKNLALSTLAVAKSEGVKKATAGLFDYLANHNSLKLLPLILLEIDKAAETEGLIMATATSAKALDQHQKVEIINKIKDVSGIKNVSLENQVEPTLLGGVKISFGDKVIDMTVKHRLEELATILRR